MGNYNSRKKVKKAKQEKKEKCPDLEKEKEKGRLVIYLKINKCIIKAVLIPPLGKLSHSPKTLSLITLPPGSKDNIFGRSEPGRKRGEVPRPPQPFPSSARLGAGDGDIQKMRRILTLFFMVESDKAEEGDSLGSKNGERFWYTVHPGAGSGWPRL